MNPIAYTFFNYKFPNGQYLIPSANPNAVALNTTNPALIEAFPEDAEIPGTAYFLADQAVADLDWNPNSTHSFAAKYYYQHDPTVAPYAYSSVAGFTAASGRRQPGRLAQPHADRQTQSERHRNLRLHSRKGLQHRWPAVYPGAVWVCLSVLDWL